MYKEIKEIVSDSDVDKIYSVICKVILDKAEEIIPKKKICLHSRGWWSAELSQCAKMQRKPNVDIIKEVT